jgi:cyd operon protein YbgT
MSYFTWFPGRGLATSVGFPNALWYKLRAVRQETRDDTPPLPIPGSRQVLDPMEMASASGNQRLGSVLTALQERQRFVEI